MICESKEQELYYDYTIHALHAPNYVLCINECPIDMQCKQLDVLCFPDLYPYSHGGQHDSREVSLCPADYIKALLVRYNQGTPDLEEICNSCFFTSTNV